MSYCTSAALPAIDGTSALSVSPRRLVLIEGGRAPRAAAAPRVERPAAGELTFSQGARFMLCGVAVILAVVLASLIVDPLRAARASAAIDALPTATVVVAPGDSLWGIAQECGVDVATSDLVSWIQERNGIEGGLIASGQTLVVPVSSIG